ncbi:armadillo repeat-containing protein 1-like [Sycon ciliatum]|uniref:armadillo repeat-containing protein 1-like n=1 Tax=Sycon ciliatum TaxID=27933 RepID=UPI0020ABD9EC|eukprot:scpid98153/ scgid11212/ Armadillo repeat-containing protein 1
MAHRAVGLELLSDVPPGCGAAKGVVQRRKDPVQATNGTFFVAGATNNAQTIHLHIDGLKDESGQKLIEEELVRVKGVISFTFNIPRQRCTVRCKGNVHPSRLCRAISDIDDMEAQQVVKKETGEEMLMSFVSVTEAFEPSPRMPDYLPEEDPTIPDNAVLRHGEDANGEGWLSSAARFIAQSLYW